MGFVKCGSLFPWYWLRRHLKAIKANFLRNLKAENTDSIVELFNI
jgi:hypothetical protein